jgi:hypothetical protein
MNPILIYLIYSSIMLVGLNLELILYWRNKSLKIMVKSIFSLDHISVLWYQVQ